MWIPLPANPLKVGLASIQAQIRVCDLPKDLLCFPGIWIWVCLNLLASQEGAVLWLEYKAAGCSFSLSEFAWVFMKETMVPFQHLPKKPFLEKKSRFH